MSSALIDNVAQAIHARDEAANAVGPFDWTKRSDRVRTMYRERAKASIAGLRDLPQEMQDYLALALDVSPEEWSNLIDEMLK